MEIKRLAIFASGFGSNAQNIIEYLSDNQFINVDCLLSNNPNAGALTRATMLGIDTFVFNREQFNNTPFVADLLQQRNIDLIVLAGFLWLVPPALTRNFTIINIHPALLPAYGGKNMYGMNVHRAVIANREVQSGLTIHYVNENYDKGNIIFQATCPVTSEDTPETLAEKVHQLEYQHFPKIIEKIALGL